MWMPHYNANTIHKESYPWEIWIGYNIELAEKVYDRLLGPVHFTDLLVNNQSLFKKSSTKWSVYENQFLALVGWGEC